MSRRVDYLQYCVDNHVCSRCGGPLSAKKVNGVVHCFCQACNVVEYGAKSATYNLAKQYVNETKFSYYRDGYFGDEDYRKMFDIKKVAEIFAWYDRALEQKDRPKE